MAAPRSRCPRRHSPDRRELTLEPIGRPPRGLRERHAAGSPKDDETAVERGAVVVYQGQKMLAGFGRHRHSVLTTGAAEVVMIEMPEDRASRIGVGSLGNEAPTPRVLSRSAKRPMPCERSMPSAAG